MPEILSPVKPPEMNSGVPPSSALQNRFDEATLSGDVRAVKAIAPIAIGTTLEKAANESSRFMDRKLIPAGEIVQAASDKGGIGTADGRMAAASAAKKAIDGWKGIQPDTSFWTGVSRGLMGVPDAWKGMTQGQIVTNTEYDKFGNGAQVSYAQNNPSSPFMVVDPITSQPMSKEEYTDRGFGLFKDASQSPFLQGIGDVFKKNTKAFQATAEQTNKSAASYVPINESAKQAEILLTDISSNYNLSNKQLNELSAITNKVTAKESAISDSINTLNSGSSTGSKRDALENLKRVAGNLGFEGVLGINAIGQVVDSTGKTIGTQDLTQRVQDYMKRNNLSSQYTQAKDDLIKSAVYQSLPTVESKAKLLEAMNLIQSNHVRMNELKSSAAGELPFLTTSIPHKMGDPFQVGIISTIFDQANATKALAFSDFFAEESKKFTKDKPPVAGQLEAAFARSPVMTQINETFAKRIQEVESRKYPETISESPVGTIVGGVNLEVPEKNFATPKARNNKPSSEAKAPVDYAADFLKSRSAK